MFAVSNLIVDSHSVEYTFYIFSGSNGLTLPFYLNFSHFLMCFQLHFTYPIFPLHHCALKYPSRINGLPAPFNFHIFIFLCASNCTLINLFFPLHQCALQFPFLSPSMPRHLVLSNKQNLTSTLNCHLPLLLTSQSIDMVQYAAVISNSSCGPLTFRCSLSSANDGVPLSSVHQRP